MIFRYFILPLQALSRGQMFLWIVFGAIIIGLDNLGWGWVNWSDSFPNEQIPPASDTFLTMLWFLCWLLVSAPLACIKVVIAMPFALILGGMGGTSGDAFLPLANFMFDVLICAVVPAICIVAHNYLRVTGPNPSP